MVRRITPVVATLGAAHPGPPLSLRIDDQENAVCASPHQLRAKLRRFMNHLMREPR